MREAEEAAAPMLSIVMPVYNMGRQLAESGRRLLSQTYQNIEIILVDDGSTDDTWEVCRSLRKQDSRIHIFHQENRGAGPARNAGIDLARGKYIYFPDADDQVEPEMAVYMVHAGEQSGADLLVFGRRDLDDAGKLVSASVYPDRSFDGDYVRSHYDQFSGVHAKYDLHGGILNKLYLLDRIRREQIRFPDLRRGQDEVFNLRYYDVMRRVTMVSHSFYTYCVNNLDRVWMKYPVNYFEILAQITEEKCRYIQKWTSGDACRRALDQVSEVFEHLTVVAMQAVFNPRWELGTVQKYRRIREIARRCVSLMPNPDLKLSSSKYRLMKARCYPALYAAVALSVRQMHHGS